MKRKNLCGASYVVRVFSPKGTNEIETLEIRDNLQDRKIDFPEEKPALARFSNKSDMLESLNWCLNCYAGKTVLAWKTVKKGSFGIVYLFA